MHQSPAAACSGLKRRRPSSSSECFRINAVDPDSIMADFLDNRFGGRYSDIIATNLKSGMFKTWGSMCSGSEIPVVWAFALFRAAYERAERNPESPERRAKLMRDHMPHHRFISEVGAVQLKWCDTNFCPDHVFGDCQMLGREKAYCKKVGDFVTIPSVDVLVAGTQCVDFSSYNKVRSDSHWAVDLMSGESGKTLRAVFVYVDARRPLWVFFENVMAIAHLIAGEAVSTLSKVLLKLQERGYIPFSVDLCPTEFGVPARRKRKFFGGHWSPPFSMYSVPSTITGELDGIMQFLKQLMLDDLLDFELFETADDSMKELIDDEAFMAEYSNIEEPVADFGDAILDWPMHHAQACQAFGVAWPVGKSVYDSADAAILYPVVSKMGGRAKDCVRVVDARFAKAGAQPGAGLDDQGRVVYADLSQNPHRMPVGLDVLPVITPLSKLLNMQTAEFVSALCACKVTGLTPSKDFPLKYACLRSYNSLVRIVGNAINGFVFGALLASFAAAARPKGPSVSPPRPLTCTDMLAGEPEGQRTAVGSDGPAADEETPDLFAKYGVCAQALRF